MFINKNLFGRSGLLSFVVNIIALFALSFIIGCSFNIDITEEASQTIPAKNLRITVQPSTSYIAGQSFSPEIEITYLDESGNPDLVANRPVKVEISNNPSGATLGTTLSATPVSALTKFGDLKITKVGAGYTLKFFNDDGLFEVSSAFDIVAAAADRLDVASSPLTVNAGSCSATPVQFDIKDEFGNLATLTQSQLVSLSAASLQFFSDSLCANPITDINLPIGSQNGQFYVSGSTAGNHTFTISSPGLDLDNQSVSVLPSSTGKLAITSTPKNLVAGVCSSAVVITSQDNFGNSNTVGSDTTVSLTGAGMSFYADSTCSGGVISNLTIASGTGSVSFYFVGTTAGTQALTGSASGLTSATQNQNIIPDVSIGLEFKVQPSSTVAGIAMSPVVEVQLVDQFGNIATTSSKAIDLAIGNNPSGSAVLVGGTKSLTTSNGVAVFNGINDIKIEKADVGYTLVASAAGLGTITSSSFNILGDVIASLEYTTSSQTLEAGDCSGVVTIQGRDQYGNIARAGANTTLAISGSGISIFSDSACGTGVSSVAIPLNSSSTSFYFKGIVAGNPIVKTAAVTSGDPASSISQNHIISPSSPDSVTFISAAQTTEAGQCSSKVEVKVGDIYGNPVPPVSNASLALTAGDGATTFYSSPGCTGGSEVTSVVIASGANYGEFYYSSTKSGSNVVTVAGSADFGSGNVAVTGSQTQTVTHAAPDHLTFQAQPALNTVAGQAMAPAVLVSVNDIYNNVCTSYSTSIGLDIQDNPPGTAVLSGGPKSVTPVAGVATFSAVNELIIEKAASGYSLVATSGSLASLESTSFNIVPATASKYRFTQDPPNFIAGNCSSSPFSIETLDSYGNTSPVVGSKTLTLSSTPSGTGQVQFFTDSNCTNAAPTSIADGASSLSLYVKGSIAGANTVTLSLPSISCDSAVGCSVLNSRSFTISPDLAFKLNFATAAIVSPNQVEAGSCSPMITLKSEDQFGNQVSVNADQEVTLSASTGLLYHDGACTDIVGDSGDPFKILSGSSTANFYFRTEVLGGGQHTTTATSSFSGSFAGGTSSPNNSIVAQVNAMKAAPPDRFHIVQQPLNSIAGRAIQGPFTIEVRDRFGNTANTSAAKTYVNISSYTPTTRPTLFGAGGLTAGPNTQTNPVGEDFFPDPPVQALWRNLASGQLIYSGVAALNIQKVGTYTLRLSTLGITYNAGTSESATFTVTNASASKLAFVTTPFTRTAGVCAGAVTVQSQDPFSNSAAVSQDTVLTPTGSGMTFYSDSNCTPGNEITQLTIANGTDAGSFYFKGIISGTPTLTVQATSGESLTQASQNQTINPDMPIKLGFSTPARTSNAGACSAVVTVHSLDQFNNNSPVTGDQLVSFGQSGTTTLTFYSNATCTTAVTDSTILNGSYATSVYVRGTLVGTADFTVTPTFNNPAGAATQTETIVPAALAQIDFFQNGTQTVTAGACSAEVGFRLKDAFGNAKTGAPTAVKLDSSQAGFSFYSDAGCTTSIDASTGVIVGAGSSDGFFYYKSTISGSRNIIATVVSPAVSQTQPQQINPAGFSRFAFTNGTATITNLSLTAGVCSQLFVQGQDAFGNIVDSNLFGQRVIVEPSSTANVKLYNSAGCVGGDEVPVTAGADPDHPNKPYLTINGAKEIGFYVKSTVAAAYSVSAYHTGVANNGTLNLTITPDVAVKLGFANNLIQSVAGSTLQASGPESIRVQILDQFNNVTNSTAVVLIDMEPTNANNALATLAGTKSVAAVAGNATYSTINITKAGTDYSLKATSAGLTSVTSNLFDVVAAAPTQITISSNPHTVVAGVCSPPTTITLVDQYGNPALAGSNLPIDLSGSNMSFYSGNACDAGSLLPGSPQQATIPNGQSSTVVYYVPTQSGTINLNAERNTAPILIAGGQNQTIVAAPASKIGFGNSPRTDILAGVCAGDAKVVTLEIQDAFGNRAVNTGSSLTMTLGGIGSQTLLYSDNSCSTEIAKSGSDYQVSIGTGGQFSNIYIKDSEAHSFTLTALEPVNAWTANQTEIVIAGPASKLAYVNSPINGLVAGVCSGALTVQSQDSNSNPSPLAADKVIALSSDASVQFFTDSNCLTTAISNITLLTGTHSGTFYFKSTLAGSHSLQASTTGLTSATQAATVTFAAVNKLGFYQQPTHTVAGVSVTPAVRVDALDEFGNIVTSFTGTIDIVKGAAPTGGILSGSTSIVATSGSSIFSDLSIEIANTGYNLVASSAGLISATSNPFNILPSSAVDIYFASAPQTLDVKNCSGATDVGFKDVYGNITITAVPTTVNLTGDGVVFYSDSACSMAVTSVAVPAGQAQGQFWYKPSKAGNIILSASATGLGTGQQTTVVVPGIPAKLAITSPAQTVRSGECSASLDVEVQDIDSNPTPALVNISSLMIGTNYTFYSDSSCSTVVTSIDIPAGQSSGQVWFKGRSLGNTSILAFAGGLASSDPQAQTIIPGYGAKLSFVSTGQSLMTDACSALTEFEVRDVNDNVTTVVANVDVDLTSTAGLAFYSDSGCNSLITKTTITPDTPVMGQSKGSFYFKTGSVVGTAKTTIAVTSTTSTDADRFKWSGGPDELDHSVTPRPPSQLSMLGNGQSVRVSLCSAAVSVETQDSLGNRSNVTGTTEIQISASHSTVFYSDATCTTVLPGSKITLGSGQNTGVFYFKSLVSAAVTITASATVEGTVDSDSDLFTITPASASKLVFTANPSMTHPVIKVDNCVGVYSTQLKDRFDNVAIADVDYDIVLSSSYANYYLDAACSDPILAYPPIADKVLKILVGQSSLPTFYMKTTSLGFDSTVLSSNAGLENAYHSFVAFPATASRMSFMTNTMNTQAGVCSSVVQMMTTDHLGYESSVNGGITINLAFSPTPSGADSSKFSFYSDSGCANAISSLAIPDGQSRAEFYYKVKKSGNITISLSATDTVSEPDVVFPALDQLHGIFPNKPVRFTLTAAPTKVSTDQCSSAYMGHFYDQFDNIATDGFNASLSATPNDVTFYSNPTCTTQIVNQFNVHNQKPFYVKSSVVGSKDLSIDIESYSSPIPDLTQPVEFVISTLPKVAFSTPASPAVRVGLDFCSPAIGIQLLDSGGSPMTVTDPAGLNVQLSANWVTFYSAADCSSASQITSVTIPQGSGTGSFYFKQSSQNGLQDIMRSIYLDENSINLNAQDHAGETYTFEVLHATSSIPTNAVYGYSGLSRYLIAQKVLLDSCVPINNKMDFRFAYPLELSFSGGAGLQLFSDSSCSTALVNPVVRPAFNVNVPTYYVKPTTAGSTYYQVSEPHLNSGMGISSIPLDVKEYQISMGVSGTFNFPAGECTAINVQAKDHLGNAYNVPADLTVSVSLNGILAGSNYDDFYGRLYSDAACSALTSSAIIPSGQNSKTVYIKNTVAPDDGYFIATVTDSRFLNLSQFIRTTPAAPTKLAFRQVYSSDRLDSVTMGACSPAIRIGTKDAFGNISTVSTNTTINLSAQEVNSLGDPAGSGYPENGVTYYTNDTCTTSVSAVTIASGESETPDFFFKTNFGRKQFALIADSVAGSTYLVLSSAMDQMAFSNLPTLPNENVYECRSFSVRHQSIGTGEAVDPEKKISFIVESIAGYSPTSGQVLYNDKRLLMYRNSDCSDAGVTKITDSITPLTGSPTQAAIEANTTRTYYMISKTLGPALVKVSSAGRAASSLYVNSRPPSGSSISFRGFTAPIEAGICSGSKRYQIEHRGSYGSITIEYPYRIELGLRTSAATGSRLIYGGSDSVVDLNSGNLQFFADPDCNTPITSVRIGANQEVSGGFYYKSTKAGPNEASGTGQVTSVINGLTGRSVYNITPGPARQIGFGSEPQTIRAGDCSEPLILQVQDQYGNEQSDIVQNEVSFLYPGGLTLHADSGCTTSLATTFIPANQSRKSVWFRHSVAGNAQISPLPVRQLDSIPQIQKILSGSAAFLRITTTPQTVPKGLCSGVVTVQVQDQPGNAVNVSADTVLKLVGESGSGTVFYTASDCRPSSEVTELTLLTGNNSKNFYFIAFKEGALPITVKNQDYVDAKQNQNIIAGLPTNLDFIGDGQTLAAGRCSDPIKMVIEDAYGAVTAAIVNTTVSLLGDNMQYFSDQYCQNSISNVSVNSGDTQKTFYFKNTVAGNAELRIVDSGQATLASATQNHTINPTIMSATQFLTSSQSLPSGRCSSPAEIGVLDRYGNKTKVNGSLLLSFSAPNMQLFADPTCTIMMPGNQMSMGHSSEKATFYFSASQSGIRTVTVTNDKLLDPTSQTHTFVSGAASKLAMKTPVRSVGAGECSQVVTIGTDDAFDQETNAGQDYTVNLTPPVGGQFYSAAGCTAGSEIATISILTGSSRSNVYLKVPATLGTITANFAAAGLSSVSQNVNVTGAGASKLVFTSAAKSGVVVETCSTQVVVGIQDSFGNTAIASGNIIINLSSGGAQFYSDVSCTTPVTSITIPNGQSSRGFYFKPSQVGVVGISAAASGLTSDSQNQGVVAGAATKLAFSSSAHTLSAGACAVATIESQDNLNNSSAPSSNRSILLGSSGSIATFYSSVDCSGGPVTSVTQNAGSSSLSFSFRVTSKGSSNLTASASGLAQALQTQTINPLPASKWAFITPGRTVVADVCSSNLTIQSQDSYSNSSAVTATTTVSIGGPNLSIYSDSSCTALITSVDIAAGTHSGTFYFKSTVSGSRDITVSNGVLTDAAQTQTVNPGVPTKLVYLNSAITQTAGTCGLLNMQFQDSFNNPAPLGSALLVTYQMSGTAAQIYSNAGCTTAITDQTVAVGPTFSAYFKSNATGSTTVRISAPTVNFADQTQVTLSGTPSKLAFTTNSYTLNSGQCSGEVGPTTVQVQDSLNNASGLTAASVLNFSGSNYQFYSDVNCSSLITSLNLNVGEHTANVYFKKVSSGVADISAAMTGFTTVLQSHTVTALPLSKVGMSVPSQTIASAACAPVTVQTQDANGNPVIRGSSTTVNLATTVGTLSIFSNSGCTIATSSVVIPAGSASAPLIYVKSNVSGVAVLEASDSGSILNSGTQTVTVSAGAASAIAFESGSLTTTAGACSSMVTIRTKDGFGNNTNVASNRTINLTATPSVAPASDGLIYYSDNTCTTTITSVTVLSGASSTNFYFKARKANTYVLSAATTGFTTITQSQLVQAATVTSLAIVSGGGQMSLPAGACSAPVGIETRDTYGNAAKPASNYTFNLTGTNLSFFADSSCTAGISNVVISSSVSAATFYYKSIVVGSYTLNIAGPVSNSTSTAIIPGTPVNLEIVAPITGLHVGDCSGSFVVRSKDAYGHYSTLASTQTVVLDTNPNRGQLYSDFGCVTVLPSNEVTISSGSSTSTQFYFKDSVAETVALNSSLAGFSGSSVNVAVNTTGPRLNLYSHPGAVLQASGASFNYGSASVDTERSFYLKNDGSSTSGVVNLQLIVDLVNPVGIGSATMWAVKTDLCTGTTLAAGASCLITVEFKAQTGLKPDSEYYYSNIRVQSAPVATGQSTIDLRLFGINL